MPPSGCGTAIAGARKPLRDSVQDSTASVTMMVLGEVVVREVDGGVASVALLPNVATAAPG